MIKSLMIVAVVAMAGFLYVGTASALDTGCLKDAASNGTCIVELDTGEFVHFNDVGERKCKKKEIVISDCGAEPTPEAPDDMTCEETIHVRGNGSTFTTVRFSRDDTRT